VKVYWMWQGSTNTRREYFLWLWFEKIFTGLYKEEDGIVFTYPVHAPKRYEVVEFDNENNVLPIEEKLAQPKLNYAVSSLYFYNNLVVKITKNIQPSPHWEYEITNVNKEYLKQDKLRIGVFDHFTVWLDNGSLHH